MRLKGIIRVELLVSIIVRLLLEHRSKERTWVFLNAKYTHDLMYFF